MSYKPIANLKKWNVDCYWTYNVKISNCNICKFELTEHCMLCLSSSANPSAKASAKASADASAKASASARCPIIEGRCGHIYHKHCMDKWLENNRACPIDKVKWMAK